MTTQPTAAPVACSLAAPALDGRLAEWRALGRDALIREHAAAGTLSVHYANRPDVAARLRRLVAAEARCCPWLGLELVEREDALVLTVTAPADAEHLVALVGGGGP